MRVKNAKHNDLVAFQPVKYLVGKAPRYYQAKATIVIRPKLRISRQQLKRDSDFG